MAAAEGNIHLQLHKCWIKSKLTARVLIEIDNKVIWNFWMKNTEENK
jgi:hypothetical protein